MKKPSEALIQHEEQLLRYANAQAAEIAILTNGRTWWFYLPQETNVGFQKRRFAVLDLAQDSIEGLAEKFVEYLSKDKLKSGEAIELARVQIGRERAKELLPEVWQELLSEPNGAFVSLIAEETERRHKVRPHEDDVREFLSGLKKISERAQAVASDKDPYPQPIKGNQRPRKEGTWNWAFCEAADPDGGNVKRYRSSVECWRAEIGDPKTTGFTGLANRDATDSFRNAGWQVKFGDPAHKENGMRVIRPGKS